MTIEEIKVGDWFTMGEESSGIFIKTDRNKCLNGSIWGVNINNGAEIPFFEHAEVTVIKAGMRVQL